MIEISFTFAEKIIYCMHKAFLLLGTNIGNRTKHLTDAKVLLEKFEVKITQQSSVYETAAWGKTDQQDFYNQVVEVATKHAPEDLLTTILSIEKDLGRVRNEKWGERIIDIDILYYNDLISHSQHLSIPHPQLHERRFTLAPLAELAPTFSHPILKKTSEQLLALCADELEVRKV